MDVFSTPWWAALASIVLIDLVLAGDNALVIGIAASRLKPELRRKAIVLGAMGAIAIRTLMTLSVVWLLRIPGLLVIGGLLLWPIAFKLVHPSSTEDNAHPEAAAKTFIGAMKTIIIADTLMGIDNVLAVGGAAHGRWDLVLLGLMITIPLVVWGSSGVTRLMERWPIISALGAAILAFTGTGMLVKDPLFDHYIIDHSGFDRVAQGLTAVVFFLIGQRALQRPAAHALPLDPPPSA
jgi:YjbE family integral membrane protein